MYSVDMYSVEQIQTEIDSASASVLSYQKRVQQAEAALAELRAALQQASHPHDEACKQEIHATQAVADFQAAYADAVDVRDSWERIMNEKLKKPPIK